MSEYIKREDSMKITQKRLDVVSAYIDICKLPAADVAPVVHGKWLKGTQDVDSCIKCSVCGIELDKYIIGGKMPEYCLCGTKMDLE